MRFSKSKYVSNTNTVYSKLAILLSCFYSVILIEYFNHQKLTHATLALVRIMLSATEMLMPVMDTGAYVLDVLLETYVKHVSILSYYLIGLKWCVHN